MGFLGGYGRYTYSVTTAHLCSILFLLLWGAFISPKSPECALKQVQDGSNAQVIQLRIQAWLLNLHQLHQLHQPHYLSNVKPGWINPKTIV